MMIPINKSFLAREKYLYIGTYLYYIGKCIFLRDKMLLDSSMNSAL